MQLETSKTWKNAFNYPKTNKLLNLPPKLHYHILFILQYTNKFTYCIGGSFISTCSKIRQVDKNIAGYGIYGPQ